MAPRFTAKPAVLSLATPRFNEFAPAVHTETIFAAAIAPADTLKVSAPPAPRSVIESFPAVIRKVSRPTPPVSVSFPAPPSKVSFPAPPSIESLPPSPEILSFNAPPRSTSLLAVPVIEVVLMRQLS